MWGQCVAIVVWRLALGLFGWWQGKESAGELCQLKGEGRGLPWAVALFFSKEGVQPAGLKEMGLGFCGCPNFFVLKLLFSKFSPLFFIMTGGSLI